MTRTRFLVAFAILCASALGAVAVNPVVSGLPPEVPALGAHGLRWLGGIPVGQPKPPAAQPGRPRVELRGTGKPQARTPQQEAGWWVDKLLADLQQLRDDAAAARLGVFARGAINQHIDAAVGQAVVVEKALGQNNRNQWQRGYDDLDRAMAELRKAVAQHARNNRAVELSFGRAEYAAEQLGAAIAAADAGNQNLMRRSIVHMAASLEAQAERLRGAVEDLPGGGPALEREARQFARAAGKFHANLVGGGNLDQARRDLTALGNQWNDLAPALNRFPNLPAPVQYQANRVDGLYRRLCDLLGVAPPVPPVPPQPPRRVSAVAVGADAGMGPRVVVYGDDRGTVVNSFFAYNRELHQSGVRVAVADLNGDGMPEVVTINGGQGHARLKVFDGRDASLLVTFDGFDQKVTPYGYFVAAADLAPDGRALVAIAPDAGGPPAVEVYDLAAGRLLGTVQPFPRAFDGGVRLAFGDVNGDGTPDLVCASGPGKIASAVKVYDGTNLTRVLGEYLGAAPNYTGGLYVAAADLTRNNRAEIVVGLDAGHAPSVRIFSGRDGKFIGEIEPYPGNFRGGVRVAVGDPDDTNRMKVICAPGPGGRDLPVKVFTLNGRLHSELNPFPGSNKGANIACR